METTPSSPTITTQLTDVIGLRTSGIFPTGKEPSIRTLREWTKLRCQRRDDTGVILAV